MGCTLGPLVRQVARSGYQHSRWCVSGVAEAALLARGCRKRRPVVRAARGVGRCLAQQPQAANSATMVSSSDRASSAAVPVVSVLSAMKA